MARIINGKEKAKAILTEVQKEVSEMTHAPKLGIFLVSDDPASYTYVNLKMKKAQEVGIGTKLYHFSESTTKEQLEHELRRLRNNEAITAALLQLPLYEHLDAYTNDFLNIITHEKDADGLTAIQQGMSSQLIPQSIPPATVEAVLECLDACFEENVLWEQITTQKKRIVSFQGKEILIINNSNLIGKPLSMILSELDATVTIANEFTSDLQKKLTKYDIIVSATGKTNLFTHEDVKHGAIVIDVTSEKIGDSILGDFVHDSALYEKVLFVTPVPGGVGPLTVACLLRNVVRLAKL